METNQEREAKYAPSGTAGPTGDSMSSTGREAQLFNRVRALYRAEVIFNMTMVGIGLWMGEWKDIRRGQKYVITDIFEDYCSVAREKLVYLTLRTPGAIAGEENLAGRVEVGEILQIELRKIPMATIESITPSGTYMKFGRRGR